MHQAPRQWYSVKSCCSKATQKVSRGPEAGDTDSISLGTHLGNSSAKTGNTEDEKLDVDAIIRAVLGLKTCYQPHIIIQFIWKWPQRHSGSQGLQVAFFTGHRNPWKIVDAVCEMAQQVKVPGSHAWQPEFHHSNPCKGRKRELTLQSCPLTTTCVPWHVHLMHTHSHTYTS